MISVFSEHDTSTQPLKLQLRDDQQTLRGQFDIYAPAADGQLCFHLEEHLDFTPCFILQA